jgi:hypothetical protein
MKIFGGRREKPTAGARGHIAVKFYFWRRGK